MEAISDRLRKSEDLVSSRPTLTETGLEGGEERG